MDSEPHFFKIIMADTLQNGFFPIKFARKYGKELSNRVVLKLPSGEQCYANLTEGANRLWLSNGWSEFAKYCNLEKDHFLVFKYMGKSSFFVFIFDKSATETNQYMKASEPHFFTVILYEALQDRRLIIPTKFAKENKEAFSSPNGVILKLPNGVEKEAGVTKRKGKVWLNKGWHEFAEYCNLEEGNFLVFKYLGNYRFRTLIFDTTTTEIHYPSSIIDKKYTKVEDPKDDDVSIEILDGFPRPQAPKEKSPSPFPRFHEKLKKHGSYTTSLTSGHGKKSTKEKVGRKIFCSSKNINNLERASDFRTENPFFKVEITQSMVQPKYQMHVPSRFIQEYDLNDEITKFILKDADGKTWDLTCYWYKSLQNKLQLNGWRKAATQNLLKVGDVCVFEMIDITHNDEVLFNFIIFPSQAKKSGMLADIRASAFTSANPFFKAHMSQSYIQNHSVYIPCGFVKRYLRDSHMENGKVMLRTLDGGHWHVKFRFTKGSKHMEIGVGWIEFEQENNIKEGDVCVFELIKRCEVTLFNVVIFRDLSKF